jgi:hypothetical protein
VAVHPPCSKWPRRYRRCSLTAIVLF